jgi:hypothetical protein
MIQLPEFKNKKEKFQYLYENKELLKAEKKATIKRANAIINVLPAKNTEALKAFGDTDTDDVITRRLIINTTNFIDSHNDVHFQNIWKKSLQELKDPMLLKEHVMRLEDVVARGKDDVHAFTQVVNWKDIGIDLIGQTEALTFDAVIRKDRNEFMFNQYRNGFIKEHSVGMQYVKIELAINDDDFEDEFKLWNTKIDQIANKEKAIENGFFWAVFEAKIIEGSAVVKGSNSATPALAPEKEEVTEDKTQEFKQYIQQTIQQIKPSGTQHTEPQTETDTLSKLKQLIKSI